MEELTIGAAEVHRLVGRQSVAVPDRDTFTAQRQLQRYGEVVIERSSMTTMRVRTTPVQRGEAPSIALLRIVHGSLTVSRAGLTARVSGGESVILLSTRGYDFLLEGECIQVLLPLRLFSPEAAATIIAVTDIPVPSTPLSALVWSLVDHLITASPNAEPDAATIAGVEGVLTGLIAQLTAHDFWGRRQSDSTSPILVAAFLFFDAHISDATVTVETIAAGIGTSARSLNRAFRSIGTTPMAAIRDARLTAIAQQLRSRIAQPTLDALAAEYGYGDRTALTRAFRRRFGRSPADYRRWVMPFGQ